MSNQILSGIWEGYKTLVAIIVTAYLLLMFVVGGEVHGKIYWDKVADLWRVFKNFIE